MNKAEEARNWAISRVGCPYIYGATGQICTPPYREARAKQYPAYDAKIRKNCPRLSRKTSSCTNCKWCDPDTGNGKRAYDCAQLTRWCMDHVGIKLVSGANSQWTKTDWEQAGEIGTMPRNKVCLVYRYDEDKKRMGHTGIYTGDGYIIHAKGHDYGVVRELLGNPKFTHWGIPVGLYSEVERVTLKNGDKGAAVLEMQRLLNQYGYGLTVDGKFGPKTENALKMFQASNGLTADGICGADTWAALDGENKPADSENNEPENVPDDITDALAEARKRLYEAIEIINSIMDGEGDE